MKVCAKEKRLLYGWQRLPHNQFQLGFDVIHFEKQKQGWQIQIFLGIVSFTYKTIHEDRIK